MVVQYAGIITVHSCNKDTFSLDVLFLLPFPALSFPLSPPLPQPHPRQPVVAYESFKALATKLSISLFLSGSLSVEEAREVSDLMTTHWHGIISVPVSIRVVWKSGYSKALAAKVLYCRWKG